MAAIIVNLATAFTDSARSHANKAAVFYGDAELTYSQLAERAAGVSQQLARDFGVAPGDRVALWMKNCPEFIPAFFGVLFAGGAVVSLNNFLKPDEVKFILSDAGAITVIIDESMAEAAEKLGALLPQLRFLKTSEFGSAAGQPDLPGLSLKETDLAVLIYTSGTTGRPKGAMLSHGNLLANVNSCRQVLAAVDADRFVVLLPMFHSFMMTVGVLLPLLVGGSLLLIKSLHPPKNVIGEIIQRGATILPAVPQFFRTLAHADLPKENPLRICVSGGAPLPGEILREFTEKLPSLALLEGYGLSEASPVVSMNPLKGPWKAGSIGVPIPDVEVTVQNDDGNILAAGQTGEICVRGSNVMLGYWNQPDENSEAIRNGWLLTGDIGHRDAEGYFYITDRKKDMLLVNGINVYPREIEETLYKFPGIKEAAVIGVPDARRGEQPVAFVSGQDGRQLEEKSIQQFVREHLADYKVPKRVIVMPALPRNATGKILKTELRKLA
jgi:long-chain acyl-CoA synthetase